MVGRFAKATLVIAAFALTLMAGWLVETRRLHSFSRAVELSVKAIDKNVRMLSRTSAIENGLRFGGQQVIEAHLNHAIFDEPAIYALMVREQTAQSWITNQYDARGLYVGEPESYEVLASNCRDTFGPVFQSVGFGRALLLFSCMQVEHDDEPVGVVQAVVHADTLLREVAAAHSYSRSVRVVRSKGSQAFLDLRAPLDGSVAGFWLEVGRTEWLIPWSLWAFLASMGALMLLRVGKWWQRQRHHHRLAKQALYSQAVQVVHDIRSPVSALWNLQSKLPHWAQGDEEVFSRATHRIFQVGEDLLARYRIQTWEPQVAWLGHCVEKVLLEFRTAEGFRRPELSLELITQQSGWGVQVAHAPRALSRIVATMIQNAVDAANYEHPKVYVGWTQSGDRVRFVVRHNGKPIVVKPISHGLGSKYLRALLGKPWSAPRSVIRNGEALVEVALELRRVHVGRQLGDTICFPETSPVLVLDDDIDVHAFIRSKLPSGPRVFGARGRSELERIVHQHRQQSPVLFVDFRLSPMEFPGPDLAASLLNPAGSYLITSTPEDPAVLSAARKWDMVVIPKSILHRLTFQSQLQAGLYILVDDDPLTRQSWSLAAEQAGVCFHCYSTVESVPLCDQGSPARTLYLDGGLTSRAALKWLSSRGYTEIYITTGNLARAERFRSEVRGIQGKAPPWAGARDLCQRPERSL